MYVGLLQSFTEIIEIERLSMGVLALTEMMEILR